MQVSYLYTHYTVFVWVGYSTDVTRTGGRLGAPLPRKLDMKSRWTSIEDLISSHRTVPYLDKHHNIAYTAMADVETQDN